MSFPPKLAAAAPQVWRFCSLNDLFGEIPIERKRLLEWVDLVADRLGVQRGEPTPWKR